ncbi:hypothetical protein R4K55_07555 [Brachyspira alvinipulli]|uniref:hypothetical protein n=1 Tax=Brachyspira alvinipulli TaxID=84379 RepID=UPI0026354D2F|nr:hypothetical protein [uncultured Brachyspira sp.]
MLKKVCCLLILIMILLSCSDKDTEKTDDKNNVNVMKDDEYIQNIVKDSSK